MNTTQPWITARRRPLRSRALALLCATLGLAAIAASPAAAAPDVDGKFTVSGVGTNNDIAKGPDGNMWVTLDQTNDVAKISPRGVVTEFNPANVTSPVGITAGPDGNIWVTQAGGVARFSPANPDGAVKFDIADVSDPRPIVTGPDGNLWTVSGENVIRIPPANPTTATSFGARRGARHRRQQGRQALGRRLRQPGGPGDHRGCRHGLLDRRRLRAAGDRRGPKSQVAYADPTSQPQKIGRVSSSGQIQKTNTPGDPFGVAFGNDNAYWFPRFATGDLVRLTPAGVRSHLGGLGPNSGPRRIATGPNHTLWVTLDQAEKVARVTGVN